MLKICKWLNKNEMSGIQIRDNGNIYPCPVRWINLADNSEMYADYQNLTLEDIQGLREKFLNEINNGAQPECQNCNLLKEVNDENAGIGPIKHLIYHPHTLCSLNCRYCFYTDEQRSTPIDQKYKDLYKTIKHLYDIGFLDKKQFALDLGGGEPLLLDGIDKTLDFMSETWENSTFYLLSNSTIVDRVNKLIDIIKKGYNNIHKVLITSVDCGTPATYENIRRKDYFYNVTENLYNYAVNETFDEIFLKYILLDDMTNSDDENIFGFLRLCKLISNKQKKLFRISIDVDWLKRKHDDGKIPDELLKVAGKMYYIITEVMQINYIFLSDYLSENTKQGVEAVKKLKAYATEYKNSPKSYREKYELNNLQKDNTVDSIIKIESVFNKYTNITNALTQEVKEVKADVLTAQNEICKINKTLSSDLQNLKHDMQCMHDEIYNINEILAKNLQEIKETNHNFSKELSNYFSRPTTFQKIFSVRNEGAHKVLSILGIKCKFSRNLSKENYERV